MGDRAQCCSDACMHQKERLFHPMIEHTDITLGVENPTGLQAQNKLFLSDVVTATV